MLALARLGVALTPTFMLVRSKNASIVKRKDIESKHVTSQSACNVWQIISQNLERVKIRITTLPRPFMRLSKCCSLPVRGEDFLSSKSVVPEKEVCPRTPTQTGVPRRDASREVKRVHLANDLHPSLCLLDAVSHSVEDAALTLPTSDLGF